jgi:hypothetical protein
LQVGWFKLDNRNLDWLDARDACAEVGAHFAAPDTPERVTAFLTLFKRHPEIPARAILRQQAYVGVSDPGRNRQFTTVQGTRRSALNSITDFTKNEWENEHLVQAN